MKLPFVLNIFPSACILTKAFFSPKKCRPAAFLFVSPKKNQKISSLSSLKKGATGGWCGPSQHRKSRLSLDFLNLLQTTSPNHPSFATKRIVWIVGSFSFEPAKSIIIVTGLVIITEVVNELTKMLPDVFPYLREGSRLPWLWVLFKEIFWRCIFSKQNSWDSWD